MKVEIRYREDNERGVFATEYIKKGEYLCILPIDYFKLDEKWYTLKPQTNKVSFKYGIVCDMISSSMSSKQMDQFISFMNSKQIPSYILGIRTKISGISNYNVVEDEFIGHMLNDYVDMSFLSDSKYTKVSKEHENVKVNTYLELFNHNETKRLGLKIYASKNIKKDEELYFTYGYEYWNNYSDIVGKDTIILEDLVDFKFVS